MANFTTTVPAAAIRRITPCNLANPPRIFVEIDLDMSREQIGRAVLDLLQTLPAADRATLLASLQEVAA